MFNSSFEPAGEMDKVNERKKCTKRSRGARRFRSPGATVYICACLCCAPKLRGKGIED